MLIVKDLCTSIGGQGGYQSLQLLRSRGVWVWYHRELIKSGAANYVVAPRPLENQRSKHQKTDRLDARVRSFLARICQAQ